MGAATIEQAVESEIMPRLDVAAWRQRHAEIERNAACFERERLRRAIARRLGG